MDAPIAVDRYQIVPARPSDAALLGEIELAAAHLLDGHAPASVLAVCTSREDFEKAVIDGHLWVALADDQPVGFALVRRLEPGVAHLDELDVHPAHGRRGLGRRLVRAVCNWAADAGFGAVTLSTFRDVPWNMPFYSTLGFEVIPTDQLSAAMNAIVARERQIGLDVSRRVVMRRISESVRR